VPSDRSVDRERVPGIALTCGQRDGGVDLQSTGTECGLQKIGLNCYSLRLALFLMAIPQPRTSSLLCPGPRPAREESPMAGRSDRKLAAWQRENKPAPPPARTRRGRTAPVAAEPRNASLTAAVEPAAMTSNRSSDGRTTLPRQITRNECEGFREIRSRITAR